MKLRIYAAARLCAAVGLLSFQLAEGSASEQEEGWYFGGCVPTISECKYTCATPQFAWELGGATCNAKDYQVRYACYCWGKPQDE